MVEGYQYSFVLDATLLDDRTNINGQAEKRKKSMLRKIKRAFVNSQAVTPFQWIEI
ncbi:MAG: hypothetical protein J5I59_08220 [Saprospiraceae bacterium]|nr:hypothetical protein [Saprospiraceae bacterium]